MKTDVREILSLSSGTIGTLTGFSRYDAIDDVQQRFAIFVAQAGVEFQNWIQAWAAFKQVAETPA